MTQYSIALPGARDQSQNCNCCKGLHYSAVQGILMLSITFTVLLYFVLSQTDRNKYMYK